MAIARNFVITPDSCKILLIHYHQFCSWLMSTEFSVDLVDFPTKKCDLKGLGKTNVLRANQVRFSSLPIWGFLQQTLHRTSEILVKFRHKNKHFQLLLKYFGWTTTQIKAYARQLLPIEYQHLFPKICCCCFCVTAILFRLAETCTDIIPTQQPTRANMNAPGFSRAQWARPALSLHQWTNYSS